MAINWSAQLYLPAYNLFARDAIFTPLLSQPGQPAYAARGIYHTQPIDVATEDSVIFSDTRTVFNIREIEFAILPVQGDLVSIPVMGDIPAVGDFEIIEVKSNGDGETTLGLRRTMAARP